jgi:hypothetical protein
VHEHLLQFVFRFCPVHMMYIKWEKYISLLCLHILSSFVVTHFMISSGHT